MRSYIIMLSFIKVRTAIVRIQHI